jgi:DNA replication protein DnaC
MEIIKVLEEAGKAAEKNININECDYKGENGLIHCGLCHTPKQVQIEFLGLKKTPFCLCKCEQEKREKEEQARKEIAMREQIAINRYRAFPDISAETPPENNMRTWTFDTDNGKQPKLSTVAKKYVENFEHFRKQGTGLLFFGTVGTGKSYMAACIANALLDKGYKVLMTSISRIADTAFNCREKQEYYDSLNNYPLIILDDLGVERNTEYMQEIIYKVIDGRYKANLPFIVTSNLTGEELNNPVGINNERTYSRILERCHPVKVDGADQRKQKAVETLAERKRLLGL